MPRLGATFDVKGDGQWVLQATLRPLRRQGVRDPVRRQHERGHAEPGRPTRTTGPAGQGIDFAPGFDLANYAIIGGSFPVANVFLDEGLNTPLTKEWTLQAGTRLGQQGEVKAVYTHRKTTNFLEDFITLDLGKTTVTDGGVSFGTFDNAFIRNTDDRHRRKYQGLQLAVELPRHRRLVGGRALDACSSRTTATSRARRPTSPATTRSSATGRSSTRRAPLPGRPPDDYQQHKCALVGLPRPPAGPRGHGQPGRLYRYDSPLTYSPRQQRAAHRDPARAGNPRLRARRRRPRPSSSRAAAPGEFESSHLFDFSLNYEVPVASRRARSSRPSCATPSTSSR